MGISGAEVADHLRDCDGEANLVLVPIEPLAPGRQYRCRSDTHHDIEQVRCPAICCMLRNTQSGASNLMCRTSALARPGHPYLIAARKDPEAPRKSSRRSALRSGSEVRNHSARDRGPRTSASGSLEADLGATRRRGWLPNGRREHLVEINRPPEGPRRTPAQVPNELSRGLGVSTTACSSA